MKGQDLMGRAGEATERGAAAMKASAEAWGTLAREGAEMSRAALCAGMARADRVRSEFAALASEASERILAARTPHDAWSAWAEVGLAARGRWATHAARAFDDSLRLHRAGAEAWGRFAGAALSAVRAP